MLKRDIKQKTESQARPGPDDNVSAFSLSPVYGRICRGVDAERLPPGLARVVLAHIVMMIMTMIIIKIMIHDEDDHSDDHDNHNYCDNHDYHDHNYGDDHQICFDHLI